MKINFFTFKDHWMCREVLISNLDKERGIEVLGAFEDIQMILGFGSVGRGTAAEPVFMGVC